MDDGSVAIPLVELIAHGVLAVSVTGALVGIIVVVIVVLVAILGGACFLKKSRKPAEGTELATKRAKV